MSSRSTEALTSLDSEAFRAEDRTSALNVTARVWNKQISVLWNNSYQ